MTAVPPTPATEGESETPEPVAQVCSAQTAGSKGGVRLHERAGRPALQREKRSPHPLLGLPAWWQEEKKRLEGLGASNGAPRTDPKAPGRGKFPGTLHGSGPLLGCLVDGLQTGRWMP